MCEVLPVLSELFAVYWVMSADSSDSLFVCKYIFLFVCLAIQQSVWMSVHLSLCLSFFISVCLSVWLSICYCSSSTVGGISFLRKKLERLQSCQSFAELNSGHSGAEIQLSLERCLSVCLFTICHIWGHS